MIDKPSNSDGAANVIRLRSREDEAARELPKRFFKEASVCVVEGGFAVELDGRRIKTPELQAQVLSTEALAEAVADEWNGLSDKIDPAQLPITRIVNTAIDGVAPRLGDVHDDILRFIGNDLLFYRAETPTTLVERQRTAWDPLLEWVAETFGAEFKTTVGIMPIEQSPFSVAKVASAISKFDAMALTSLHVMTSLTGSALLAIAYAKGHLAEDEVWSIAHVDEDWQIEQWGSDAEAEARRAARFAEMQAAARVLVLLGIRSRASHC